MRVVFLTLAAVGVGLVSAVPITPTSDSLLPCAVCPAIAESDDLLPFILTQSTEGLLSIILQCDYTNLLGSASCSYFNIDGTLSSESTGITCPTTATLLPQSGLGLCTASPLGGSLDDQTIITMRNILLAVALDIVVLELVSAVPMQESLSFPCAVCPLLIAGGILTSAVEKEGNSLECSYNLNSNASCLYFNEDGALLVESPGTNCQGTATILPQPGLPCIAVDL
ncbi:MAG: hypothetical protein NXY57DRAFT_975792 [Lentinula lateritia]|nr:MAG: hypothetical protein NXY57DRAFT_975792 [Lentinula lateritia]